MIARLRNLFAPPVPERSAAVILPRAQLPLRIATILDPFSQNNLEYDCELLPVPASGYRRFLRASRPHFLFVESAWTGNGGAWKSKLEYVERDAKNPLPDLLAACRELGIPTVFWNKEDPTNYEIFIGAARQFDFVFTTDGDCVERYRSDAPGRTVGVLPFAAQPAIEHPVERDRFPLLGDICFAGAWYPRYPDRQADMRLLLDVARDYELTIYDRNANQPGKERFAFPSEYASHIKGSLPFEQMLEKYRQYRLFLNINTVKDSPTMFSRRVFEILACGTPVVSTESRALRELLGDAVPQCSSADETRAVIDRLLGDPVEADRLVLRAQREIFGKHTYRHRLREVCRVLGVGLPPVDHHVTVLLVIPPGKSVEQAIQKVRAQSHTDIDIVPLEQADESFEQCAGRALSAARGPFVATMSAADLYGEHYLVDSLHALEFSGADAVGKHPEYRDRFVATVPAATRVFRKIPAFASRTYSAMPYNYLAGGAGTSGPLDRVCF